MSILSKDSTARDEMANDSPWGRRLVICCDGTWQSSVSTKENVPSNVTKLCRVISRIGTDRNDPNKKWHQLVYYDSGIGTGALSGMEAKRQGGLGAGLSENVIEAYNFIVLNYEEGDEIFCFGFSRGAYTARAVAGLVTEIGVIKPTDMQFFPKIYREYMKNDEMLPFRETQGWKELVEGKLTCHGQELNRAGPIEGLRNTAENFESRSHHSHNEMRKTAESFEILPHYSLNAFSEKNRKVKVVGVWDTVGSLGVPDVAWFDLEKYRTKYGFHNVRLNENIEHAYHALALDERRKAFRPTLWYIDYEMRSRLEKEGKPVPELKQVWFPGVHINCGGGAEDCMTDIKGDLDNISNATWTWMLQCISPHLTIDQDAFKTSLRQYQHFAATVRYACTYHHTTWLDTIKSLIPNIPILNPEPDPLLPPKKDPAHTHPELEYGWGTGPIVDSYTGMYHLNGALPRVPGNLKTEVYDHENKCSTLDDISKFGVSNEYIHPICEYRKVVRGKDDDSALKSFTRTYEEGPDGKNGRYWWYKGTTTKLPEWVILDHGEKGVNFERTWYETCQEWEKSEKTKARLEEAGYEKGFLETLDKKIDFTVANKPGYV